MMEPSIFEGSITHSMMEPSKIEGSIIQRVRMVLRLGVECEVVCGVGGEERGGAGEGWGGEGMGMGMGWVGWGGVR